MKIEVLAVTPNPAQMIVWVARFSHRSHARASPEADATLFRHLVQKGHWSALEFNRWTAWVDIDTSDLSNVVRWLGEVWGWEITKHDGIHGVLISGNARTLLEGRHTVLGRVLLKKMADRPGWEWLLGKFYPMPLPLQGEEFGDIFLYVPELGDLPPRERAKHAAALFVFRDISRACANQLVRHRRCSFMQESLRYVDPGDDEFWITPRTVEETQTTPRFEYLAWSAGHCYRDLVERGVPKEDARYVLPLGTKTTLVVMASLRQWAHIIDLRTSPHAQWEIRERIGWVRDVLLERVPWFGEVIRQ